MRKRKKKMTGFFENKVFASGQAIREASLTVLRPTVHGSERAGRKNIFYADSPQAAGY